VGEGRLTSVKQQEAMQPAVRPTQYAPVPCK